MQAFFLLAVFSISVWITGRPAWGQTKNQTRPPQTPANNKRADPQIFERGTKDAPIFVHIEQDPQSQANTTDAKNQGTGKDFYDKLMAWSAASAALFTLVLVIVGWCAVRAAKRTLRAIEDQGKQMKRQVDLMQAQFDQSVELINWRTEYPRANSLPVTVDLVNLSDFPVTLSDSYLRFRYNGDLDQCTRVHLAENAFLSSQTPLPIPIQIAITAEQQQSGSSLSFQVDGRFSHLHKITKERIVQPLTGLITCEPLRDNSWIARFTPFIHMNPEVQKSQEERQTEGQNPN